MKGWLWSKILLRWRTTSCKVWGKTQDYFEEPSDKETEMTQLLCPLKVAYLLPPGQVVLTALGTQEKKEKKKTASLPSHLFGTQTWLSSHGRALKTKRILILQLHWSWGSLTPNSPREHGISSFRKVCLLLCFLENTDWHSRSHREVDPGRCCSTSTGLSIRVTDVMSHAL